MKYFINCSTIDELKKEYKRLAFIYHPDIGGSTESMQELNNAYDEAMQTIGKANNKKYSIDNEYKDIIESLIKLHMDGVIIEICGWFVWLTGNTKPYKEKLGREGLGLHWNYKKNAWYYKPSWYVKKSKNIWSMNEIRDTFGSEVVEQEQKEKFTSISA
jgi:hypothetical protein